ncbi:hypothetical protein Q5752_000024 [Cryptotrichosporon argae]
MLPPPRRLVPSSSSSLSAAAPTPLPSSSRPAPAEGFPTSSPAPAPATSTSRSRQLLSAGFASRARSALASASTYVASTASSVASAAVAAGAATADRKASWDEWMGRRGAGQETINVLPGWAVRRARADDDDAFDLHVLTLGFCSFVRDPRTATRTQRALMAVAKRFAALPPLPVVADALSSSPTEESPDPLSAKSTSSLASSASIPPSPSLRPSNASITSTSSSADPYSDPSILSLAHNYLDARLRPFWSATLPNRRVALSMYTVRLSTYDPSAPLADEPLMRTTFTTNAQGHFEQAFAIPWERLASHVPTVELIASAIDVSARPRPSPPSPPHVSGPDSSAGLTDIPDWGLVIRAELLAEDGPTRMRPDARPQAAQAFFASAEVPNRHDGDGQHERGLMGLGTTSVESKSVVRVVRPGGVRVISDLDDTVKHSDIISGPREVFRNVFCRRLEDICVPGMNELYAELADAGVSGFHFVSNSPFELFPVVSDFLKVHSFPSYSSLKLKFYGGRSIITSLFEPAGERKRPAIVQVLDAFAESGFVLFGDSGEQDLELYVAIARERPEQIRAIFIRDVTTGRVAQALRRAADGDAAVEAAELAALSLEAQADVAAGVGADSAPASGASTPRAPSRAASSVSLPLPSRPGSTSTSTSTPTPTSTSGSSSTLSASIGIHDTPAHTTLTIPPTALADTVAELDALTAAQQKVLRRAAQWEARVARAKELVPASTGLVFFKHVDEIRDAVRGYLH